MFEWSQLNKEEKRPLGFTLLQEEVCTWEEMHLHQGRIGSRGFARQQTHYLNLIPVRRNKHARNQGKILAQRNGLKHFHNNHKKVFLYNNDKSVQRHLWNKMKIRLDCSLKVFCIKYRMKMHYRHCVDCLINTHRRQCKNMRFKKRRLKGTTSMCGIQCMKIN